MRRILCQTPATTLGLNLTAFAVLAFFLVGCTDTQVAVVKPKNETVTDVTAIPASAVAAFAAEAQGGDYGSISGKVTLGKAMPELADLTPAMKKHADWKCCLDPNAKDVEKKDLTWVVDPKTKAVANVMVWVAAPKGKSFPIHKNYLKRTEKIVLDQPHCQFLPRVVGYQPYYKDNGKIVETGQTLSFKNSAVVNHNVRVIGNGVDNDGFNVNVVAKTDYELPKEKDLKPQRLPLEVRCDIHTWMSARIFVFDHPYYCLTNEKGEFDLPYVPAGTELTLMAWHEGVGYVLLKKDGEKTIVGEKMKIEGGKKTTFDIVVK
jgi:hypothetical protein